jgi:hypothetical protein
MNSVEMPAIVIQTFGNRENSVVILAIKRLRQTGRNISASLNNHPTVALNTLTFQI